MKKTLIALAALGAVAGVAQAQSNVTIYGIVDTGFVKETGHTGYMNENINNRLGFMGSEDLGGGLKATFQLEQRFDLFNGRSRNVDSGLAGNRRMFDGAANVGLAGNFGQVRMGRVNEISTETIRTFDPFQQYGIGGSFQSALRDPRLSNTVRYDSPVFSGFSAKASYTLKNDSSAGGNDGNYNPIDGLTGDNYGWALNANYANGPFAATANYNKAANTDDSYNWNIGASYAFGPAKVMAQYEKTKVKQASGDDSQKNWLVGATYKIGAGLIQASYGQQKIDSADGTDKKFAIGYTHNLSKRTALYAQYAYTKDNTGAVSYFNGDSLSTGGSDRDSFSAYQVGITHRF